MVPRRMQRAFSIAEVLVALGVFTFGIAVIYDQFINTKRPSQYRLEQAQASELAQRQLEELRAADFASLQNYNPPASFQPLEDYPDFYSRTTLESADRNGVRIAVEVGWNPVAESGNQEFEQGYIVDLEGYRYPS